MVWWEAVSDGVPPPEKWNRVALASQGGTRDVHAAGILSRNCRAQFFDGLPKGRFGGSCVSQPNLTSMCTLSHVSTVNPGIVMARSASGRCGAVGES